MKSWMKKIFSLGLSSFMICGTLIPASAAPTLNDSSEQVSISYFTEENTEEITYEEMIARIANNRGISVNEARKMFPNEMNQPQTRASVTYKYVESRRAFNVTSDYRPSVYFYIYMGYDSQTGKPIGMSRLVDYTIDRNNTLSNSIKSKQFSGELYVELLNAKELYYRVSGDFYNNGTTSVSFGGSIGIGEYGSVKFSISYSGSHYKYCFYSDTSKIV